MSLTCCLLRMFCGTDPDVLCFMVQSKDRFIIQDIGGLRKIGAAPSRELLPHLFFAQAQSARLS